MFITQDFLVTTRLTMSFQHCSKAREPKPKGSISLKGAKSSWWCYRSSGFIILRIDALYNLARDSNDVIDNFKVARIWTIQK